MDERLTDLEVKVAFQDHALAQLDEVVRALRDEVDALRHELRELRQQPVDPPADESRPPPHY